MKRVCLIAITSIGLMHVVAAGPLDEARSGNLQCYAPNIALKTCNSLAGYTFDGGKILNQEEVLISPDPLVIMKAVSPVEIRGNAVCGSLRKQDLDRAKILAQGRMLNREEAAPIKGRLESALGSRFDGEICTTYLKRGSSFTTQVTIDGIDQPKIAETVIWVKPSDGYRVAP